MHTVADAKQNPQTDINSEFEDLHISGSVGRYRRYVGKYIDTKGDNTSITEVTMYCGATIHQVSWDDDTCDDTVQSESPVLVLQRILAGSGVMKHRTGLTDCTDSNSYRCLLYTSDAADE